MTGFDQNTWYWWAGRDQETYTQGPFDKKEEAIDEAFAQSDYEEEQAADGRWLARVYVAEHKGTEYECDECGTVDRACDGCAESLLREEARWYFKYTRNEDSITRIICDDGNFLPLEG